MTGRSFYSDRTGWRITYRVPVSELETWRLLDLFGSDWRTPPVPEVEFPLCSGPPATASFGLKVFKEIGAETLW